MKDYLTYTFTIDEKQVEEIKEHTGQNHVYDLTPKEMRETGTRDDLYEIDTVYYQDTVLIPDKQAGTIRIMHEGHLLGYVEEQYIPRISSLIESHQLISISTRIYGSRYKKVTANEYEHTACPLWCKLVIWHDESLDNA